MHFDLAADKVRSLLVALVAGRWYSCGVWESRAVGKR